MTDTVSDGLQSSEGVRNGALNGGAERLAPRDMMSRQAVAKRLRRSKSTVIRLERRGRLPLAAMIDGVHYFRRPDVEQLERELREEDDGDEQGQQDREVTQANVITDVVASSQAHAESFAGLLLKSTAATNAALLSDLARLSEEVQRARTEAIEAVKLVRDLIIDQAKLESERLTAAADQTLRIERTRVAAQGFKQILPVAKAGLARWIGMPALARESHVESLVEIIRGLKAAGPEKLARLGAILSDEQRDAVACLIGFAEGRENMKDALRILKRDMTPERGEALMRELDDKQLTALSALLDDVEDEPAQDST